ncbi:hypothetical protein Hanom_Chr03g00195621 [Helianthus anomalus]
MPTKHLTISTKPLEALTTKNVPPETISGEEILIPTILTCFLTTSFVTETCF